MKKLLNNPWIVGALALAAVAFVGTSLYPLATSAGSSASAEAHAAHEPSSAHVGSTALKHTSIAAALQELSIAPTPRDPFSATTRTTVPVPAEQMEAADAVETLRLSAIWIQGADTFVLINGRIRQAGDEFSRFKIESATRDGVWVTHWKGRDFLTLGTEFTLTTPATKSASLVPL